MFKDLSVVEDENRKIFVIPTTSLLISNSSGQDKKRTLTKTYVVKPIPLFKNIRVLTSAVDPRYKKLMDNSKVHHAQRVRVAIESVGSKVKFLGRRKK